MSFLDNLAFEAGVVARSVGDYLRGPTLRLGVTGLSRSGKTVFVTSLVNNLLAEGAAAGSGGLGGGPHRQGAARSAAGRRGAAVSLRGAPGRAGGPRPPLAAIDQAHFRTAAAHRLRPRRRLESGAGAARPRHRRLSRRMAARPDAARQELRALVERDDRDEPRPGARRARRRLARPSRRARPAGPVRRGRARAKPPGCSPNICAPRAPTSTPCRPCRRAAF